MSKILIVEDDINIKNELNQILRNNGYSTYAVDDYSQIDEDIETLQPDLILLDINLPHQNGFDICKKIKLKLDIPVLFVTSRDNERDELYGLILGADDYITKPYNIPILLARISNILKKSKQIDNQIIVNGVNLDINLATLTYQNISVELTKNEFKILFYLMNHHGRIVKTSEIIDYLWENKLYIDENILNVNLSRIRKKLKEIGVYDFIKNKRGMGYII